MLQQFTWQQFLIAALVLSLIWYAVVIILFFRKKLSDAIKRKSLPSRPRVQSSFDPRIEMDGEEPDGETEDELIGKPKLPEGVQELSMSEISFAPKQDNGTAGELNDRLGRIPDVLEELKTLFNILKNEGGTKDDFFSLFSLIKSKYPGIKHSPHLPQLNEFILENLTFSISQAELDTLWD